MKFLSSILVAIVCGFIVIVESQSNLDTLHKACLAEGGRLIIYAGGDTPGQQDFSRDQFMKRFKNTTLDMIVDYSKFHDARIDIQLSEKKLVPDVTQLQTLQDFPRWRDAGVLLAYKPDGWDKVDPVYKDPNGYFTGFAIYSFTNVINKKKISNPALWPTEAKDFLREDLKGEKLVVTYPHDDDAILFWFKLIVDKYGWDYVKQFRDQKPKLVRGSQEPFDAVERDESWATPNSAGDFSNPASSNALYLLPSEDPFMTWPQTAAIFKDAKHPNCAKLYMSWILDKDVQANAGTWPTRTDVDPPVGLNKISDYISQTNPLDFGKWMADRAAVERFKTRITLLLGEVKGDPSPGPVGLYQDKALAH